MSRTIGTLQAGCNSSSPRISRPVDYDRIIQQARVASRSAGRVASEAPPPRLRATMPSLLEIRKAPLPARGLPPAMAMLDTFEFLVCLYVAAGITNRRLAEFFDCSLRTIELTKRTAAEQLGVPTRELVVFCASNSHWLRLQESDGGPCSR